MERITTNLVDVVVREMNEYVWDEPESRAYLLKDETRGMFVVFVVPSDRPQKSVALLAARINDDEQVIIDTDRTDRPLYEALIRAGIPRSHIIRAYLGKTEAEP